MTTLGRSHEGNTIWFDLGHGPQEFDESQVLEMAAAFNAPHPLYPQAPCQWCGDDAVGFVDGGRFACYGHAQAFTYAEEGS